MHYRTWVINDNDDDNSYKKFDPNLLSNLIMIWAKIRHTLFLKYWKRKNTFEDSNIIYIAK